MQLSNLTIVNNVTKVVISFSAQKHNNNKGLRNELTNLYVDLIALQFNVDLNIKWNHYT